MIQREIPKTVFNFIPHPTAPDISGFMFLRLCGTLSYVNKNNIMAFVWVLYCFCFSCKMIKLQIQGFHLTVTTYGIAHMIYVSYVNKNNIMAFVWVLYCFCFSCKMIKLQIQGFHLTVTTYGIAHMIYVDVNCKQTLLGG